MATHGRYLVAPAASTTAAPLLVGFHGYGENADRHLADNLRYVNAVIDAVKASHETNGTLVFCGFSQGVAMAYRAAICGHHKAHGIMALAGDIPPELKVDSHRHWPAVLVGRGEEDDWYTHDKLDQDIKFLRSLSVPVKSLIFLGGHEWTEDFRIKAGEFLSIHGQ